MLKPQQRFRSEKHNVFTEKVNTISKSANDDKRIQTIDSIESNAHGTKRDLVCKKNENKCNNIIKEFSDCPQKNINDWNFRIWKNKCIIQFNKLLARY